MPQCNGITGRGERCGYNALPGETRCRIRHRRYMDGERCIGYPFGIQCERNALPGQIRCMECANEVAPGNFFAHPIVPNLEVRGELLALAHDPQNVHTKVVVDNTQHAVGIILALTPESHHANKKTYTELILECPLTIRAMLDFGHRYWSTEVEIYGHGPGIYFKLVNSIWSYTKKSPHKEDICKIIASELDDTVGMCAQGALSRLCNILAGYVPGIGEQRSKTEIVGDALSAIARNSDLNIYQKFNRAREILEEHEVPQKEWTTWMEPMVGEGEDDCLIAWRMAHEL